jgi:hypothetical protein
MFTSSIVLLLILPDLEGREDTGYKTFYIAISW